VRAGDGPEVADGQVESIYYFGITYRDVNRMSKDGLNKGRFVHPMLSAAISAALAIAVGVFSGSLVSEITVKSGLDWSLVPKTFSFYALLVVSALQIAYTKATYERDQKISRFSDQEYCVAYMRAMCLPEMAAKAQERIRNGQGGEFNAAMDEIRQVLK
jgi:hypothetical protein